MNAPCKHRVSGVTLLAGLLAAAIPLALAQTPSAPPVSDPTRDLFGNFMHHAVVGNFEQANAYAEELLASKPDPLDVLRYTDEYTNAGKTLILLVSVPQVSDSAKKILELVHEGELLVRQDPQRIKLNIEKLGGDPLSEFNSINRLKESGEYAVPWLLDALADPAQSRLHARIIRTLPKLGKSAVVPLCEGLDMDNDEIRQFIVQALGEIGYPQAAPYLLRVRERAGVSPELRVMADEALVSMGYSGLSQASEAFQDLALQYYKDEGSVQADARTDRANIWSWNGQRVERIEVPRAIYNEIMSMRCCEATLRLNPADEDVIAIWVAANIQREAELGMDVKSVEQDPAALADATKPENFPRSAYFARAAGARYCHKVLDLALEQDEPAVALGAIAALRRVAGESSLVGSEEYKLALAEALTYTDAAVRINAALALAGTSPTSSFAGAQHVVSALAEGLSQTGGFHVVVVDPDPANLNRVLDVVRAEGARAVGDASLYAALERARLELPTVDAFFLATDVSDPELGTALAAVRANNLYKMTPLVLLTKEGQSQRVKLYDEGDDALTVRPADAAPPDLVAAWSETTSHVGQTRLSGDDALSLALECADALHSLGVGRSTVLDIRRAEGALINAFRTGPLPLQVRSADVLALIPSASAQQAIAGTALDPAAGEELRVAAFGALAGSARTSGNLLTEASADALINLAINEPNLTLRSAASEALGALDLPGGKASRVILTATGGEKP